MKDKLIERYHYLNLYRKLGSPASVQAALLLSYYLRRTDDFWIGPGYEQAQWVRRRVARFSNPAPARWFERQMGQVPEAFWLGLGLHQSNKVKKAVAACKSEGILSTEALAHRLLADVKTHRKKFARPFFVMSAAGSGSTWLGAMLGDLPGCRYAGEVYLPKIVSYLARQHNSTEIDEVIRAILLLHSWTFNQSVNREPAEIVNSARSIHNYDIYKRIWPDGRFIFLMRDPRDQVLSTTYRKPKYRRIEAPHASDARYLKYNAIKARSICRLFNKLPAGEVYTLKYEDLVKDTPAELAKLLKWAEFDVTEAQLEAVLFAHNAGNIRQGIVSSKGNLDEGGESRSWVQDMSRSDLNMILPILEEALESYGYQNK